MASVWVSRADLDALPPACACCGAPAAEYRPESFHWLPWWSVFLLPTLAHGAHLFVLLHKQVTVRLPFCPEHTGYRERRRRQGFRPLARAVLASALVLVTGALVLLPLLTAGVVHPGTAARMALGGLAAAAVPVAVAGLRVLWLGATGLRVTGVSGRGLTLCGVADEFAQTVEGRRDPARA